MGAYAVIGFLTDYGLDDGFVATCHGVMARLAPDARVVDVTHLVPPQDVRRGAAVLAETVPWFPPAVLVAVVDPGVGTPRRAVAVEAGRSVLVGPDNGVLSWTWQALGGVRRAVALDPATWPADESPTAAAPGTRPPAGADTFHGRDVFSPAAARVAAGTDPGALGPEVAAATLVTLPAPYVRVGEGALETEVLTVDRFGNLQLAARPDDLAAAVGTSGARVTAARSSAGRVHAVRVTGAAGPPDPVDPHDRAGSYGLVDPRGPAGRAVPYGRTFADVEAGEPVLLVDSAGRLALAVNHGSAADLLHTRAGDRLTLEPVAGEG